MNKYITEYISHCNDNKLFPNAETFVIWVMRTYNIDYKAAMKLKRDNKEFLDTNSIAFLKDKIGNGGRNSLTYVQLLKEYTTKSNSIPAEDKPIIQIDLNDITPDRKKVLDET